MKFQLAALFGKLGSESTTENPDKKNKREESETLPAIGRVTKESLGIGSTYSPMVRLGLAEAQRLWMLRMEGLIDPEISLGTAQGLFASTRIAFNEEKMIFSAEFPSRRPISKEVQSSNVLSTELVEKLLQEHVSPNLKLDQFDVVRYSEGKPAEFIARLPTSLFVPGFVGTESFLFSPETTSIESHANLSGNFDIALKTLEIVVDLRNRLLGQTEHKSNKRAHHVLSPVQSVGEVIGRAVMRSSHSGSSKEKEYEDSLLGNPAGVGRNEMLAKLLAYSNDAVHFHDIKGYTKLVKALQRFAHQLQYPEKFIEWGVTAADSLILVGPPGTGKTFAVKALATESGLPLLVATPALLTSKWLGESENKVRLLFEICNAEAERHPSGRAILFLDEVEAMIPSRNEVHEVYRKQVTEFLTAMDGFASSKKVIVIAATNRKELIDEAFLSRMKQELEVPLPDEAARVAIWEGKLWELQKTARRKVLGDINLEILAKNSVGFSGRDIRNLVLSAASAKADLSIERNAGEIPPIDTDFLLDLISKSGERPIPFGFAAHTHYAKKAA